MLRVLIVEDSDEDFRDLQGNLRRFFREIGIPLNITRLTSLDELGSNPSRHDLIFLDTNPQKENGIEGARNIRKRDTGVPIVLVSSRIQDAPLGYEVDASAFIEKPINPEKFASTMKRITEEKLLHNVRPIALKSSSGIVFVLPSDIVYVTVEGHNLTVLLADGKKLVDVRCPLSSLEKSLEPQYFTRISKNCLIGLAYVDAVNTQSVTMLGGDTLPISRVYAKSTRQALAHHYGEGSGRLLG